MAYSMNRAILIGNLGADPEIRQTQDGRAIANLRVATNETWTDRVTREQRERTEWHRVTVFNDGLVKSVVEKFLRRGTKVYVEGQIRTRKWQDKTTGQDRYSTEIVVQGYNSHLHAIDGPSNYAEEGAGHYSSMRGQGGGGSRSREQDDGEIEHRTAHRSSGRDNTAHGERHDGNSSGRDDEDFPF